jgi:hypothetical protein
MDKILNSKQNRFDDLEWKFRIPDNRRLVFLGLSFGILGLNFKKKWGEPSAQFRIHPMIQSVFF